MSKYRKRPVVIDAAIWDGHTLPDLPGFDDIAWSFPDAGAAGFTHALEIRTLEGNMYAAPGDWIIRGVRGEFYPCKPDIFEATYEAVG